MNMHNPISGLIIKATGGFYYVQCDGGVYQCRARGIFRKEGISPLVGDTVKIAPAESAQDGPYPEGTVDVIEPRKNELKRPPLANLDRLVIVSSLTKPRPDLLAVDRLASIAEYKGIEPVIVFSKIDTGDAGEFVEIYKKAGFSVCAVCNKTGEGVDALSALLQTGVSAFTGNTGVGKSSLLNRVEPRLLLAVGDVSQKLGRGRHTTRTVELFPYHDGYLADTPGFSSLDLEWAQLIRKEELQHTFREFAPFVEKCRFTGCSHTKEKGCAVLEAVENGMIPRSRHESYCALYDQAKEIKDWEFKDRP